MPLYLIIFRLFNIKYTLNLTSVSRHCRSRVEPVHQLELTGITQGNETAHQKEAYGHHENVHRQPVQPSAVRQLDRRVDHRSPINDNDIYSK